MNSTILRRSLDAPTGAPAHADAIARRLDRYAASLRAPVRRLAQRDARLADLAASFPALLFGMAVPRPGLDPAPIIADVIAGAPLADLAIKAGIPLWMRKLPPEALTRPLPRLPDSTFLRLRIANHLPRKLKRAASWLDAVATALDTADEAVAVWLARELTRDGPALCPKRLRVVCLWAWHAARPGTHAYRLTERRWSAGMSYASALAAARVWWERVELELTLAEADGTGPLRPGRIDGLDLVPLRTAADVEAEAAAMGNCLRGYGSRIAGGAAVVFSVRRDDQRLATVEIRRWRVDGLAIVGQIKGPGNAPVPPEVAWAVRRWLHAHPLPELDLPRGIVALSRPTWTALWRPYWLAKRRIPDWLPLAPSFAALDEL